MKITRWKKTKARQGGQMIAVNRGEALLLIASLAKQLAERDCNTHREEFQVEDGDYLSISVHDFDEPRKVRSNR